MSGNNATKSNEAKVAPRRFSTDSMASTLAFHSVLKITVLHSNEIYTNYILYVYVYIYMTI